MGIRFRLYSCPFLWLVEDAYCFYRLSSFATLSPVEVGDVIPGLVKLWLGLGFLVLWTKMVMDLVVRSLLGENL